MVVDETGYQKIFIAFITAFFVWIWLDKSRVETQDTWDSHLPWIIALW